jgi:purine-binding chemotaxis protein CheW
MAHRPEGRHGSDRPRAPIDWPAIRRRIEAVGASAAGVRRSPESVRALLDQRARQLAEPEHAISSDAIDAITFQLAGETYGIVAEHVSGVSPLHGLTVVPGADEPVLGITEWRGDLLTILDLRRLLRLPVTGLNDLSMVIVLGGDRPVFGILADAVTGLASIVTTELYLPVRGTAATSGHVRGLTREATILLNAESLLASSPTRSE